ncbi:histidine phosphatase family protein [Clostridium kluyveri]|uniref:Histidine phosphatase family protein n=1 Tax=Clostridium kluyveri TaxID=1534 RepID=A0A1L5FA14_CLOKL|nr:histidine phosphatase family protein [Clostridium kluyveri]APM39844.1 histidine phosphatase family protein [Clostridium kluyveri]UZQ49995.1 histidine phosphatase family protein [Clostridium kluyveri]
MNNSLLDLLRGGGYILYVRHGEATVGEDQPYLNFLYCFTQRNLSEMGRRQAIYYGQILRNLRIPINYPVLTSPFCRTIETAQLAFGRSNVQIDPFWFEVYKLSGSISAAEQRRILGSFQSRLEVIPPQGSNKVIIAHSFPEGIGLGQIPNMGTVIVRPRGQGNGYEIISKLSLSDLVNLGRYR